MQYDKKYDHLLDAINVSGTVEPTTTTKTTTTETTTPPIDERLPIAPKRRISLAPFIGIAIIGLLLYFIASRFPKDFNSCRTFPASRILETYPLQCRTFYGGTFTQSTFAPLDEDFNLTNEVTPSTLSDTTGFEPTFTTPAPTASATGSLTTKGGLPITSPANTPTPAPTSKATLNTPTVAASIPVQAETTNAIGDDWVKHRYPDQKIAFYAPKGWQPKTAVRNRTTGKTTIVVSPNLISFTVRPDWSSIENAASMAVNYELNGSAPGRKQVGGAETNVYFERNNQVYNLTCRNDFWATCNIMLKNIEL